MEDRRTARTNCSRRDRGLQRVESLVAQVTRDEERAQMRDVSGQNDAAPAGEDFPPARAAPPLT